MFVCILYAYVIFYLKHTGYINANTHKGCRFSDAFRNNYPLFLSSSLTVTGFGALFFG